MEETFADLCLEILQQVPVGIVVWRLNDPDDDESLYLVGANRTAERMTGRDLGSWVGHRMDDVLPGTNRDRRTFYATVARTGVAASIGEVPYEDDLGAASIFSVTAIPLRKKTVLVYFENLTQQKANEKEAQRLNAFLDAIIENIPHMVFVKEAAELRFERINRAGEKLLGVDRTELLGKNDYDFFPAKQAAFFQDLDRKTLESGVPVEIPEEPIRAANGERILHTKKVPIRDVTGVPRFLLGISEDVTERKTAEREILSLVSRLEERRRELEESNAELDGFTYSISHDLRAPLRAVAGFTRVLVEDHGENLDEEGRRIADVIARNTEKMGRLIDDLLKFSRFGRHPLDVRRIDMTALVTAVAEELAEPGRPIELRIARLPDADADPSLMRHVWANLLDNAIKYTRNRADAVIEVEGRGDDREVVYSVKDNGIGFEAQYAPKVFGVFERLHPQSEFEGTGVGLALVHRIVRRHGGWVTAEGEPGVGATFAFGLPRKGDH